MQQRQLRLGDILDDYCPRERRLTNHAVVAMVGDEVKQTRCTTCDADHEYKQAKVPRQRRKDTPAGLQAQVMAAAPKRIVQEPASRAQGALRSDAVEGRGLDDDAGDGVVLPGDPPPLADESRAPLASADADGAGHDDDLDADEDRQPPDVPEGPAHRRLIRATLPRTEGQPPPARPAPDFTIRHPTGGRPPNRFRPRQPRAGQAFQGNRSGQPGGDPSRGGMPRNGNGRSPASSRPRHHDGGRKRSK